MAEGNAEIRFPDNGRAKGQTIVQRGETKMKEMIPVEKFKFSVPFISLLITIAVFALTSAYMVYKSVSDHTYHQKWKDYDDCGLA